MKINEHTALLTPSVLLVPYSPHHVPEYHRWMQNEDLQKATASEPLSLEEEYSMQKSWREDVDKLTFIACLPQSSPENDEIIAERDDADDKMLGDVNLFLFPSEDDEGNEDETACVGELEIMIARPALQNHGLGTKILLTFLWYITQDIEGILSEYSPSSKKTLKYLRVKIDAGNERSIKLFGRIGFTKTSPEPNYFNELELRLNVTPEKVVLEEEPKVALYRLSAT